MKKSVLRISCFLVILLMILNYWSSILKFKSIDGIFDFDCFYDQPKDSVDVLVLGSSHAFNHINTGVLWDDFGMASYVLAGSIQPMWNTYHHLKEALKTQHPKLIILEGYMLGYTGEYIDDSRIIKNNYGMHWSSNKIESIKASCPPERIREFWPQCIQYHSRYKDISFSDFYTDDLGYTHLKYYKGFVENGTTASLQAPQVNGVVKRLPLAEKTEKYYRAILSLAQEEGIPIMVIVAPYAGINDEHDTQRRFNTASDIAAEMGVPFLNFNNMVDELGIDFATDAAEASHLNHIGNRKLTRYLGSYIAQNYDIPDRRGDEYYISWEKNAEVLRQAQNTRELHELNDTQTVLERSTNSHYRRIISIDGNWDLANETAKACLSVLGINEALEKGIYVAENGEVVWDPYSRSNEKHLQTRLHDIYLRSDVNENGEKNNTIVIDNKAFEKKVENGINVILFNTLTDNVVFIYGLDANNGFALVK